MIAEINAAIRISFASIGARGVSNREKRAPISSSKVRRVREVVSFLFLSFPPFPSRMGCVPSVTGASIPSVKNTAVAADIYLCNYAGTPSKYRLGVSKRGDALKMQSANSRDHRCT